MNKANLVIVSKNQPLEQLTSHLTTYHVIYIDDTTHYMNTLINQRVAVIIVNGEHPDWKHFTTTPKVSPATRRIPILFLSEKSDQRSAAVIAGADLTFTMAELEKQITKMVQDYARIPDPELMKQLDCECNEPLPSLAIEGVKKFNAGEYYPQHDLFEEQWVNTEGPVRDLYRAVLQVGVAYYQIERGNYRGALKMLQRSVQWLAILPDVCQGIHVEQLRKDSYAVRAELERLGADRLDELDRELLKPLQLLE